MTQLKRMEQRRRKRRSQRKRRRKISQSVGQGQGVAPPTERGALPQVDTGVGLQNDDDGGHAQGPDVVHPHADDLAVVPVTEDDHRGGATDGAQNLQEGDHHLDDVVCRQDDAVL